MSKQEELDDNVLANWLGKVNKSIEPHSKLIAIVVGALIFGGIVLGLASSQASGNRSDATYNLLMAQADLDQKYPGTPAASWSVLNRANQDLDAGIQSLYLNRSDAETLLSQCKVDFENAMSSSEDPLLKSRAQLGIALASESLGELDDAIQAYKSLISINESDAMNQKAQMRIDELSRPDTKEFIAWFEKQDFTPADPSLPPELPSGAELPDMPPKLPPLSLSGSTTKISSGEDKMDLDAKDGGLELPEESDPKKEVVADKSDATETPKKAAPEKVTEKAEMKVEEAADEAKKKMEAAKAAAPVESVKEVIEGAKKTGEAVKEAATEGVKESVKDAVEAVKDAVK